SHFQRGNVDLRLTLLIGIGGIIGSVLGSWAGSHLPGTVLKKIFAMLLLLIALNTLADAYGIIVPGVRRAAAAGGPAAAAAAGGPPPGPGLQTHFASAPVLPAVTAPADADGIKVPGRRRASAAGGPAAAEGTVAGPQEPAAPREGVALSEGMPSEGEGSPHGE